MREYRVIWNDKALKELSKLDKKTAKRIEEKVNHHLCKNPERLGEALTGGFAGLHKYRIGDYRVIYKIQVDALVIAMIRVGHRKDVYEG